MQTVRNPVVNLKPGSVPVLGEVQGNSVLRIRKPKNSSSASIYE
jgi:hypothetical protein